MRVLLDTSVVLRVVGRSDDRLRGFGDWEHAYASELMAVEALRALANARLRGDYDDATVVAAHEILRDVLESVTTVGLSEGIMARAGESFPTIVGALDAIHISTALALEEAGVEQLAVATHDVQLGRAALAVGLEVIGLNR